MNCISCYQPYDQIQRIPRVLVECGHTLCEMCIITKSRNQSIVCVDCGKLQFGSVQTFPKNMTLLSLTDSQKRMKDVCPTHKKQYEAFCEKDKELLCVTCILYEQHRGHNISSITQTVTKDKEILAGANQRIGQNKQEIQKMAKNVQQLQQKIDESLMQSQSELYQFYSNIRSIINSREDQTKAAIQALYEQENDRLDKIRSELSDKFEFYCYLSQIYESVTRLRDIDYLNEANKRLFIVYNSVFKCPKFENNVKTTNFQRLDELKKIQQAIQYTYTDRKIFKKREPLVLELNLHEKYKKHVYKKKTYFFYEYKINLSYINFKHSRYSSSNMSAYDVFRYDMTLSIKDHNMTFEDSQVRVFHVGGINNQLEIFDFVRNTSQVIPISVDRSHFQAIVIEDLIYIIGGRKKNNTLIYDTNKNTLQYSTIKVGRCGFGAVSRENSLLVLGGSDGKNLLNTFEEITIKTNKTKKLPSMVHARYDFSAVMGYDGKLYAIGGCKSCYRYDFTKNKWENISQMKDGRRSFAAVAMPDGIYVFGGIRLSSEQRVSDSRVSLYNKSEINSVEKYDYYSGCWYQLKPMPEARSMHSAVSSPDLQHIYIFGGFSTSAMKSIEIYSIVDDSWRKGGCMATYRYNHVSVIIKQKN